MKISKAKKTRPQKLKLSKRRFKNRLFAVVFVLLFSAAGGYLLYRGYAATDPRRADTFPANSSYFQHPAPASRFRQDGDAGNMTVLINDSTVSYPQLLWLGPGATFKYYTNGSQAIKACFQVRDVGQALFGSGVAANVTFSITNNSGAEVLKSETATLDAKYAATYWFGYFPYCITTNNLPNGKQFNNLQYRIVVNSHVIQVQGVNLSGIDFNYAPPATPSKPATKPKQTKTTKTTKTTSSSNSNSSASKPQQTSQQSSATPVNESAKVDSTPPSKPTDFKGTSDPANPGIQLNWTASKDDVAVAAYKMERSEDEGKTWKTLSASIKFTNFFDFDTQFDTQYKYKLRAIDTNGNASKPVTTDVLASSFQPNAGQNQAISLTSDDNVVTVQIPVGALIDNAICTLQLDSEIGTGPNVGGYVQIGGPYNVICKGSDSAVIDSFAQPLSVIVNTNGFKDYKTRTYYTKSTNGSDWAKVSNITHSKKDNTDNLTVQNGNSIVVMGKLSHTPLWVKLLIGITVIGALAFGCLLVARRLVKRRVERKYDDYYHKSTGL